MLRRMIWLITGIALAMSGMGLTVAFGILAFIGMPLLVVGLACISAATAPSVTS